MLITSTTSTTAITVKETFQHLCETFQGKRRIDLTTQLIAHYRWPTDRADQAIAQYLMFLSLASIHRDQSLVPTVDIDCVWEADILQDTARYVQLCQCLCGEIIHHVSGGNVECSKTKTAFKQTLSLFSQQFGHEALGETPSPAAACGVLLT